MTTVEVAVSVLLLFSLITLLLLLLLLYFKFAFGVSRRIGQLARLSPSNIAVVNPCVLIAETLVEVGVGVYKTTPQKKRLCHGAASRIITR